LEGEVVKGPRAAELLDMVKRAAAAGDYEKAHIIEDRLLRAGVRASLSDHPDAKLVCLAGVRAINLDYPRWYA
jgi:hypothetical protein